METGEPTGIGGGAALLRRGDDILVTPQIIATLSGRSSPPKVASCGAGDKEGRRGACWGT